MRVDLDAKVRTRDGEDAGSVERVVLNPETKTVTHFVLSTGGLLGRNVLMPRDELERADRDGDAIRVRLTKDELEQLPTFRDADYMSPPAGWVPPVGLTYPYGGIVWPMGPVPGAVYPYTAPASTSAGYAAADAPSTGRMTSDAGAGRDQPDQRALGKGAIVLDCDGDDVGVVEDVRYDAATGELRGFVLRVGGMLRTLFGGGETVEVDRREVVSIDTELVRLSIDKETLKRTAEQHAPR